jgi:hypothetical protein
MINNKSEDVRLKLHDNLSSLKSYVDMSTVLNYDGSSYVQLKDSIYYKNICLLLKSVG